MLLRIAALLYLALILTACAVPEKPISEMTDEEIRVKANELAQKFIIMDGHIDIPYRLDNFMEDISGETAGGDFDYPMAKAGGLNGPFMSIYIPASYQVKGGAKAYADSLIDMVEKVASTHPDKFAVAVSTDDIYAQFKRGVVSLPMGMENGAPIEGDLANVKHFYDRGVRYITLTHSKVNHICDSSYDEERKWNGLSPFGEEVVAEMNRVGMIIDVSHISDSTFYDVMKLSKAPVFASHSSARKFTADWERNMGDDMIKLLAEKDGVISINFGSSFLKSEFNSSWTNGMREINAYLQENKMERGSPEASKYINQWRLDNPVGTIEDVMEHIDHVVELVGVNHVAFGSDFDGVLNLPKGLQTVAEFPNLIFEMLKRGYSEEDIEKICGLNMLRVWKAVEKVAGEMQ
ncbi:MAG: dipeptidase [Calditrichia bacterium]